MWSQLLDSGLHRVEQQCFRPTYKEARLVESILVERQLLQREDPCQQLQQRLDFGVFEVVVVDTPREYDEGHVDVMCLRHHE